MVYREARCRREGRLPIEWAPAMKVVLHSIREEAQTNILHYPLVRVPRASNSPRRLACDLESRFLDTVDCFC